MLRNEPVTFALRKAIEKGVVDVIEHSGVAKELMGSLKK